MTMAKRLEWPLIFPGHKVGKQAYSGLIGGWEYRDGQPPQGHDPGFDPGSRAEDPTSLM